MTRFAARTGLISSGPRRRYLWTDAFAVCNFLGLARATGEGYYRELALDLVESVHHELGRHRRDDRRFPGCISGLSDEDGDDHPTYGGLRIGKPFPERDAEVPLDADLEWERDGQYFHYLTKWMHALDQTACATGDLKYHLWARELAVVAHRAFSYGPPHARRMAWKLSIDLSRPLVAVMGQHDPLDGFVTCAELDATSTELDVPREPSLADASADFASMLEHASFATDDPLGIGGLLFDAMRLVQAGADRPLVAALLEAAVIGLRHYLSNPDLRSPAEARLGFRELGLAIGLAAIPILATPPVVDELDAAARATLTELSDYLPLRTEIEAFWLDPDHQKARSWKDHEDIDDVMLATSLVPHEFLVLTPSASATGSRFGVLGRQERRPGGSW
ncbi:hypothetical protein [Labilithrix luteola]|nr:hypothetical protein [Labilithrix luteola]